MLQKHSNICNSLTKHSTIYYKTVLSTYMNVLYTFFKNLPEIRAIPEKRPGRGRQQETYFSMGVWCEKFSNYMGHWLLTKSNYMGGWYFAAWKGKKEYYLPQKERSFIKSSQKKA